MNAADLALFQEFLAFKAAKQTPAPPIPTFDAERATSMFFRTFWSNASNSKSPLIFEMLRCIHELAPQRFTPINNGQIHSSADLSRTYYSVKVVLNDSPGPGYRSCVIHFYGGLRGSMFRFKSVDVIMYDKIYEDVWTNSRDADGSSLSSGGR